MPLSDTISGVGTLRSNSVNGNAATQLTLGMTLQTSQRVHNFDTSRYLYVALLNATDAAPGTVVQATAIEELPPQTSMTLEINPGVIAYGQFAGGGASASLVNALPVKS